MFIILRAGATGHTVVRVVHLLQAFLVAQRKLSAETSNMYYLMYSRIHATGNIPGKLLIAPEGRSPKGAINNSWGFSP